MPQRPRQHELEDASRRAFESFLPDRLVYRATPNDYGVDGEVEEFVDGEATGLRFYVQLKATDEAGPRDALRTRIRLSTAAYFRAQVIPVLMVKYLAVTDSLYGRWFHHFDPYYENAGDQHLTFHWDADQHLLAGEEAAQSLLDEAAAVAEAKSNKLELPVRAGVELDEDSGLGFSPAELELSIRAAAKECPYLVEIVPRDEDHILTFKAHERSISAHVAGLGSVSVHLESDETIPALNSIGTEFLSCASLALARAGHADVASRLGQRFFAGSWLARLPPMSLELAETMAYSGRASDAVEMAERLEDGDSDEPGLASFAFLLAALRCGRTVGETERLRLVEAIRARIARRRAAGDANGAAGDAVGLGNFYLGIRDFGSAVEVYELALELDPEYESRSHYWQELGGARFLNGDFDGAAEAYRHALDLNEEPELALEARWADALMCAGKYEHAYEVFAPIAADTTELGAWAAVKTAALHRVISVTGIRSQERDPERATRMAARFAEDSVADEEVERVAREIWEADALSALGAFNLGRAHLDRGEEREALFAYLITAVMQEGDVEAWRNVVSLSLSLGEDDLCEAAIVTGARLNGERFMLELTQLARDGLPDQDSRDQFLAGVNELLDHTLTDESEPGYEVRFVSGDQPVESVRVPPPGSTR